VTFAELAQRSGVAGRTIRFYIARGLMQGPATAGRNATYSDEHLKRLGEIRKFQQKGMMLAEIAAKLSPARGRGMDAESWWQYEVGDGVRVMLRDGLSPWRVKLIREALADLKERLRQQEENE
jgi:DNA-binding transcriptional MerR regulator